MSKPRILIYDLETTPSLGYTWGKYDQTVLRFVKHRELLSVSWKWVGEGTIYCDTRKGEATDKRLAKRLRSLFEEADITIAHNGNAFDKKIARTRMIAHRLPPVKSQVSIDTRLVARSYFDFNGNSLSDLCGFFNIGSKLPTQGIDLWLGCMRDEAASWAIMAKYNRHDVLLLDKLYTILRPWIENHPNVAKILAPDNTSPAICPTCASKEVQKRGTQVTATQVQQRWQCNDCGRWYKTRYIKEAA